MTIRTVRPETLKDNGQELGDGESKILSISAAKTIEYWIDVESANAADFTFDFQTAQEKNGDPNSSFNSQSSLNITAPGVYSVVLNRVDHALGQQTKVAWSHLSGDMTFSIKSVVME